MVFKINSYIIFEMIVECLNTAPIMKACHFTGVGAFIPDEICNPARELCQGLFKKLVENSGFEIEVVEALEHISEETISKVFSGSIFRKPFRMHFNTYLERLKSLSFKWRGIRTFVYVVKSDANNLPLITIETNFRNFLLLWTL